MFDLSQFHHSPGRRLVAAMLCALLVLGCISPGLAVAGEGDSEGEGTGPTVELPAPPDFDPGGEETGLEESPAPGEGAEEEVGPLEPEAEIGIEAPPAEIPSLEAAPAAEPAPIAEPAPEPAQQPTEAAAEPGPVANDTISAPPSAKASAGGHPESVVRSEPPTPAEPEQQEAPPSPQPVAPPPADPGRSLAGRDSYTVRPGDCLWRIAAALLPPDADAAAIESEVARLWRLNESRVGTGDPSLIYAGTTLRLR